MTRLIYAMMTITQNTQPRWGDLTCKTRTRVAKPVILGLLQTQVTCVLKLQVTWEFVLGKKWRQVNGDRCVHHCGSY